jgi:hypothetical protein
MQNPLRILSRTTRTTVDTFSLVLLLLLVRAVATVWLQYDFTVRYVAFRMFE